MTLAGAGSVTRALARSLFAGLTLLWLIGAVGSGYVLRHLIDDKSDDELEESAAMLLSIVDNADDALVAAAIVAQARPPSDAGTGPSRLVYQVRDAQGTVLFHSGNAPRPELAQLPLVEGFADAGPWRVVTLANADRRHFVQLADPLAERDAALAQALLWLIVPLAGLLAFAGFVTFRASRSLVDQVRHTALAMEAQDPRALAPMPVDGVATEMRPAIEATNALMRRVAAALEAERSFTYNSAHEVRTPIAGALAQAQLLAATAPAGEMKERAEALVVALTRIAALAERLLALARAEGGLVLSDRPIDLHTVARLTVDEFEHHPALNGRTLHTDVPHLTVRGDVDAIGLAVRNLVQNAIVHGNGGNYVRIFGAADGDEVSLGVIDDGPGVEASLLPGLARRFARAPGAGGGGAGLGLAIVDTLARRMGATLRLESPPAGLARGFSAVLVWPGVAGDPPRRRDHRVAAH